MALTITNSTNTLTFTVGRAGADGADGADGAGIAAGGTTGQVLAKASNTDYDTTWTSAGAGDMLAATYDPTSVAGDAFSMDSMVEGATTKILTATERTKLAGIETGADVTDTANVTAAGALMDSEVTNLAAVKAFDPTAYATAAQGTLADSATQPGDNISTLTNDSGFISSVEGTAVLSTGETGGTKFLREDGDGTCSWQTITGGGDALTTNPLSQFAATTSAQLAGVISDETGTGALVFANSPTLVTPALGTPSALVLTNATGLPEAQVTAHQAALSITESQISDLGAYITGITSEPLSDLSDVTITTIASGEILKWNGTGWINNTLAEAGIATSAQGALADSALQSADIDTLAELNAIITDATLIDTTDSRLSDSRPCDGTFDNATTAKTALSLENVENTALSTWAGSTAITTLGTIAAGTWQGTAIGDTYISSASTWNAKIANLSEDTTPQLGGSLDVNGNKIVSTTNGNIDIEPNGTGNVLLGNFTFDADQTVGAGQDNYVLTYDNGTGLISLEAASGGGLSNWGESGTTFQPNSAGYDLGGVGNEVGAIYVDSSVAGRYSTISDTIAELEIKHSNGGIRLIGAGSTPTIRLVSSSDVLMDGRILLHETTTVASSQRNKYPAGETSMAVGHGMYFFNSLTDASNYERLRMHWSSNQFIIDSEAAGTGTQRDIVLNGANRVSKISDVSSGTDTAYETAINAIIDALEAHGLAATV